MNREVSGSLVLRRAFGSGGVYQGVMQEPEWQSFGKSGAGQRGKAELGEAA